MMIIPVVAFATNYAATLKGYWRTLLYSPTLRFIALGSIMYVLVSLQGTFEALRSVNTITHFTHFTVAHAHLGMYAFVTITFFGGIYFVMPRVVGARVALPAPHRRAFLAGRDRHARIHRRPEHRRLAAGTGDARCCRPFMDSVKVTIPWLEARSIGGAMMTAGHLVFAAHFLVMVSALGPERSRPALFRLGEMNHA